VVLIAEIGSTQCTCARPVPEVPCMRSGYDSVRKPTVRTCGGTVSLPRISAGMRWMAGVPSRLVEHRHCWAAHKSPAGAEFE